MMKTTHVLIETGRSLVCGFLIVIGMLPAVPAIRPVLAALAVLAVAAAALRLWAPAVFQTLLDRLVPTAAELAQGATHAAILTVLAAGVLHLCAPATLHAILTNLHAVNQGMLATARFVLLVGMVNLLLGDYPHPATREDRSR